MEMRHLSIILAVAGITAILRLLPFLLFGRKGRNIPTWLMYLSQVLPSAIIGLLVVYSLRSVNPFYPPYGLPELLGVATAVLMHRWKHNTLLSVFSATALYMILLRLF
ncbi:MAG: branched-chain amino acid transporter AzlD [Clostridiales bacterium]|jgi:branched-subunit amino acid transport protein AzlD|nr:branched-chain amino acid transporter AzlD [Clostridiales bacterium]